MNSLAEAENGKKEASRLLVEGATQEQKEEANQLLEKCDVILKFLKNQKINDQEIKHLTDNQKVRHIVCYYFNGEGFNSIEVARKLSEVTKTEFTPIEVYDHLSDIFGEPEGV